MIGHLNAPPTMPTATPDPAAPLRRITDLPGPRGLPGLGQLLQLDPPRFHQQLEGWCRAHGPLYQLRFGRQRVLVVGDHALVAGVLRDRPEGFRRPALHAAIGQEMGLPGSVFRSEGAAWARQRRMVMAGLDPTHVRGYYPSLLAVAQRLAGRWQRAALAGQTIDLQADLMRYTVDAVAGLTFGAEVNTLDSDGDVIQQHLDKVFPALYRRALSPLPYWRWLRLPADRQLDRSVAAINAAVAVFIDQARTRLHADPQRRAQPPNLLEAMLVAADEPDSGIDDEQVAGNVVGMLLAGEDTTANTLAWMIHLLWRHPLALARATEELRRVVPEDSEPTLDQLARLEVLEACAHETMRLKPVAPQIPLQALRDTVVGGVRVPAGAVLIGLLRMDSVSDAHLPQADRFEPGRWLAGGAGAGAVGAAAGAVKRVAMPFGAGPRICPGRYLALLEMRMAMAQLLGRFDIDTVFVADDDGQAGESDGEAAERLSFTMAPVGLRMRLRLRG